jgi:UDP-N-acetylmuramoylalanine--D-glutamate ligase
VFDIAVFLNLSADHLERHGGMHGYAAAKRHIFDGQDADDTAVVGIDDAHGLQLVDALDRGPQRVVRIAATREADVAAHDGRLIDGAVATIDLRPIPTLPGSHNGQNAAAAYAVTRAAGLSVAAIALGMASYPGLPHRQELVATIAGIRYINDSKATNADSAARALACYAPVYWIAGGLPKEGGIATLAPQFQRIRHAFLVGTAADTFAETLESHVPWSKCGDVATALAAAHAMAQRERREGAVVLLSPACASFDQWRSFEARGDAFRSMVMELAA